MASHTQLNICAGNSDSNTMDDLLFKGYFTNNMRRSKSRHNKPKATSIRRKSRSHSLGRKYRSSESAIDLLNRAVSNFPASNTKNVKPKSYALLNAVRELQELVSNGESKNGESAKFWLQQMNIILDVEKGPEELGAAIKEKLSSWAVQLRDVDNRFKSLSDEMYAHFFQRGLPDVDSNILNEATLTAFLTSKKPNQVLKDLFSI